MNFTDNFLNVSDVVLNDMHAILNVLEAQCFCPNTECFIVIILWTEYFQGCTERYEFTVAILNMFFSGCTDVSDALLYF